MTRTRTTRNALRINNATMILYGLTAVLLGPTLPGMIRSFDLTLSQAGLIGAAQNAGGFAGALIALAFADRVSFARATLISYLLLAVATFTVGLAGNYLSLLLAIAATGLFIRTLDVMLNSYTGVLATEQSARAMSTLHLFFSVGAIAGPLVARAVMGAGLTWSQLYRYWGIAYVLVAVAGIGLLTKYIRHRVDSSGEPGDRARVSNTDAPSGSSRPTAVATISILGAMLLFYAIHQMGVNSWIPYYLETARGAHPDAGGLGLSAYWVGIMGGRFLSARIADRRVRAENLLLVGFFLSSVATFAAVLTGSIIAAQVLLVGAGLGSGATIPLAYAVGYRFLPSRTGGVTAAMSVIMLAGRFFGPWVIGVVADRAGLILAMTIPAWALLFSGAMAVALILVSRRAGVSGSTV